MICFNPGPLVIWCFTNGTTLTHFSFRKRFQVQYYLSEIFYRNFPTNGKRSLYECRKSVIHVQSFVLPVLTRCFFTFSLLLPSLLYKVLIL